MDHYDLIVVGGGSAGQTAATIAAKVGAKVLLADKERLGGDCLHHGCVPSKALIRCARAAHEARTASRFGVQTGEVRVDFAAVMDHVHGSIEVIGATESAEVFESRGVEVAFGGARFQDAHTLVIGDRTVSTDKVVLAVGSQAAAPPIPGLAEAGAIDHVGVFALTDLPERLAIIGGGPIGVEMGQAFARLGSQVSLVQRGDRLLPRDDADLAKRLQGYLAEELQVLTQAEPLAVERAGDERRLEIERQGQSEIIACDAILVAAGRRPKLDGLDLDRAGVQTNDRGVVVDENLRTTAGNIWAAGDCTGAYQFTHFAEAQARVAARNALFAGKQRFVSEMVPWATFSDPELAHIGLTEAQATERGVPFQVFRFDYADLDRAVVDGSARGLAKLVCEPDGRILGASLLGPLAAEAIAEIAVAMKAKLPIHKVGQVIHIYPAFGRIVRRLADERFLTKGIGRWTKRLFGRFKGS